MPSENPWFLVKCKPPELCPFCVEPSILMGNFKFPLIFSWPFWNQGIIHWNLTSHELTNFTLILFCQEIFNPLQPCSCSCHLVVFICRMIQQSTSVTPSLGWNGLHCTIRFQADSFPAHAPWLCFASLSWIYSHITIATSSMFSYYVHGSHKFICLVNLCTVVCMAPGQKSNPPLLFINPSVGSNTHGGMLYGNSVLLCIVDYEDITYLGYWINQIGYELFYAFENIKACMHLPV